MRKGFDRAARPRDDCASSRRELLLRRALITPSCGAGGVLTEPLAERVLKLLRQLSSILRNRHGFDGQR